MEIIPFLYRDIDGASISANTYLIKDENNACVIIDPSKADNKILDYLKENSLLLKAILLTHTHFDHMKGVNTLLDAFKDAKLYVGNEDIPGLTDAYLNCSYFEQNSGDIIVKHQAISLFDNDLITELSEPFKVISTPYHTVGSVCFYLKSKNVLFSGDSLFFKGVGRTDLPSSCGRKMRDSLYKLSLLPGDTRVYPGHGVFTYIKNENLLDY